MFGWGKKDKKQAGCVTHVQDVKEQSSVKVQNVNNSTAENVVCAEQVNNSFNNTHNYTTIYNYYSEKEQKEIQVVVNIHHLPEPTTALIGRKTELAQLTETFTNPDKHLAIIVAAGGIGKSALTDEWLQQIAAHNYYGKTRVFGWSFYSQGSHNTFTNSQAFFSAVLPFLGITEIPKDEIEKARLLVRCLCEQSCLLILDGLEPLQYAQNLAAMNGEVQDSALKEFIACFRRTAGKSFVLFSSRQPLVELKKWLPEHYTSLDLKTLPHEDGADLLQSLGVTGKAAERQAISQDLNGHALSLVLFGHLLVEHHQGDPRYAQELKHFPLCKRGTEGDLKISPNPSFSKRGTYGDSDAEKDSRHALRVLDYYDSLQDEASRSFLQLLGLFDRPMNAAEKAVLIANANHAEPLRASTAKQWQTVEQRLEKIGLLLGKKGTFERLEWDTHPIIRAYFGEKFKECYPEEFKQAHRVLFDYYQKLPEKKFGKYLPDTLEEMQPLYQAVIHGCLAMEYQQAFEVYWNRVCQNAGNSGNDVYYSLYVLVAYSKDIVTLTTFFPIGWKNSKNSLSEIDKAELLAVSSFCLMSLGRLYEAIEPREVNIKLYEKLKKWKFAAISAQNLVDLYISLGYLIDANVAAKQALYYAQQCRDAFELMGSQSRLATVSYYAGHLKKAVNKFQEAEIYDSQHLTSLKDFHYCSLLLDTSCENAILKIQIQKIKSNLKYQIRNCYLIGIALDYLSLARIYVTLREQTRIEKTFLSAIRWIRKANKIELTPPFYLYRADYYLTQNQLDPALADLMSALEIIERCGMKLYQVDYLLIHGRYCLATDDHETALNHYEEAKQLIQETGYHLRDAELYLFAAVICRNTQQTLESKTANDYLQKAKNRIEEIGQWGLMPRYKQVANWINR